MKEITKLGALKNYDIKITFKENNKNDMQMLIFLNNELAYATKKNSFKFKNYTTGSIKFEKMIPRYVSKESIKLAWNNKKEKTRFINWCKRFKLSTCLKLQEECTIALNKVS